MEWIGRRNTRDNGDVEFLESNNSDLLQFLIHQCRYLNRLCSFVSGLSSGFDYFELAFHMEFSFLFYSFLNDFMCACLSVCTCSLRGQWKVSDPLELEWKVLLGCHASAGDRTHVLWKSNKYSYLLNHVSRPSHIQCWSNSIPMLLSNGLFNSTESIMPFHQHKYFHCSQLL